MIDIIYLDHSATTPVDEAQKTLILKLIENDFGNPSSLHKLGVASEKYIKKSRSQIAKALAVNEKEILFTSGGTESNNLAIQGCLPRRKKGKIITTVFEHPSVLNCVQMLESQGYDVCFIPVSATGVLDMTEFENSLTEETLLVSVMMVNNEVGTIQPLEKIGQMIASHNQKHGTKALFHVDAVQGYGKLSVDVKKWGIDLMSFSAHKINGIKGSGALYIREGVTIAPLQHGGGQEKAIRPGTENILGIASLGLASEMTFAVREKSFETVKQFKSHMIDYIERNCEFAQVNGLAGEGASPYILNVSFKGIKGEVLLHTLEMKEIFVSTGSACSSKKKHYSHVLEAMKLSDEGLDGAIRISFSKLNTLEEVERASEIICDEAKALKRIIKRR